MTVLFAARNVVTRLAGPTYYPRPARDVGWREAERERQIAEQETFYVNRLATMGKQRHRGSGADERPCAGTHAKNLRGTKQQADRGTLKVECC